MRSRVSGYQVVRIRSSRELRLAVALPFRRVAVGSARCEILERCQVAAVAGDQRSYFAFEYFVCDVQADRLFADRAGEVTERQAALAHESEL
jgi:hypothetical protein